MSIHQYLRQVRASLSRSRAPRNPRPRPFQLTLEKMEERLAPTCNPIVTTTFPVLRANCDNAANTLTLSHAGTTTTLTYTGGSRSFADSTFGTIDLNMGSSADTVNVQSTVKNVNVTGGGGRDNVNLNANVGGIAARIDVSNSPVGGYTALTVDATTVPFAYTASLSEGTISFGGFPINYAQNDLRSLTLLGGRSDLNTYNITNTPLSDYTGGVVLGVLTTVRGGPGVDRMNVQRTATRGRLNIDGNGELDFVNLNANAGGIQSLVHVSNPPSGGFTALAVDAAAVAFPYTATLSESTISFGGVPISYAQSDLRSLTLNGGSRANTYNITNTPQSIFGGGVVTTVVGGSVVDTMNVLRTTGSLTLLGGAGDDAVQISPVARNLDSIQGYIQVNGGLDRDSLVINDQANAGTHTWTLSESAGLSAVRRTGSAAVEWNDGTGLEAEVRVHAGAGASTFNVTGTQSWLTTLDTGPGDDMVNVRATRGGLNVAQLSGPGNDIVNIGNTGRVRDIQGVVSVSNPTGRTAVNVNDQNEPGDRVAILDLATQGADFIRLTDLAPAPIYSVAAHTSAFTVNGGQGHDIYFVLATAADTTTRLNGGNGDDAFVFGEPDVSGLAGTVYLDGQGGNNFGRLNDSGVAVGRSYSWDGDTLGFGTATFTHANLGYFYLYTGLADDTVQLQGMASVYRGVLDSGGVDTLLGPDTPTTWALTGFDTGSFLDFEFYGVENLVGGSDDDDFVFADGAGISGYIVGGTGQNRLSYEAYTTDVLVSLPLYTATGVGWFISQIGHANGGSGNDILVGDERGNRFSGGPGRDLLIGGGIDWATYEYSFVPDLLVGNDGDDILIGGFTAYDFDPASLTAILAEWTRDASYEERMGNLTTGAGVPLLDATTVYSNYAGNILLGGEGRDLFFGRIDLDFTDWDPKTEVFVEIG